MPLEKSFHACPVCGATVGASRVTDHRSWHEDLERVLHTAPTAELALEPWPAGPDGGL